MSWESICLSDIAEFSNGVNFRKESYGKGVKLISVSDFGNRFYPNYSDLEEIKANVVRSSDYLENGDIIFVRSNGNKELVGRCMLINDVPCKTTYSGFCIRCRVKDQAKVFPKYLAYYFKTNVFRQAIAGNTVGANIQNLSQGRLSSHCFNLPDLPTQHRIASILSAYDDLIENNQKQIKLLEEAAQRLYKEWFVDLRFPGWENTKIVDGVPEGWEKLPLSSFADIVMGQSPKSEFYNTTHDGIPFHQGVGSYGKRFVVDNIFSNSYARIAEAGSILFSVRAPVGRLNITKNKIAIGRGLAALNHKKGYQSFLFYLLKDRFFKDDLLGNGSIFASISKNELYNQVFIVPNNFLANQFNIIVPNIDRKISIIDEQLNRLVKTRDRLLSKLMNAEMEV